MTAHKHGLLAWVLVRCAGALLILSVQDATADTGAVLTSSTLKLSVSTLSLLAARASCSIQVIFKPVSAGAKSASLRLTDGAAGPSGNDLYIADWEYSQASQANLIKLNPATGAKLSSVPIDGYPGRLAISADGKYA